MCSFENIYCPPNKHLPSLTKFGILQRNICVPSQNFCVLPRNFYIHLQKFCVLLTKFCAPSQETCVPLTTFAVLPVNICIPSQKFDVLQRKNLRSLAKLLCSPEKRYFSKTAFSWESFAFTRKKSSFANIWSPEKFFAFPCKTLRSPKNLLCSLAKLLRSAATNSLQIRRGVQPLRHLVLTAANWRSVSGGTDCSSHGWEWGPPGALSS